jgi:hypothetical protein
MKTLQNSNRGRNNEKHTNESNLGIWTGKEILGYIWTDTKHKYIEINKERRKKKEIKMKRRAKERKKEINKERKKRREEERKE